MSTDEGVKPLGRIATTSVPELPLWDSWGPSGWGRGVFTGDHVYAVTGAAVQAVPLADLSAVPYRLSLE